MFPSSLTWGGRAEHTLELACKSYFLSRMCVRTSLAHVEEHLCALLVKNLVCRRVHCWYQVWYVEDVQGCCTSGHLETTPKSVRIYVGGYFEDLLRSSFWPPSFLHKAGSSLTTGAMTDNRDPRYSRNYNWVIKLVTYLHSSSQLFQHLFPALIRSNLWFWNRPKDKYNLKKGK